MVYGLIVSGGKGLRMGSEIPKQFLPLAGIPVLIRTLMIFDACPEVDALVLVLPEDYLEYFDTLGYKPQKPLYRVKAGEERQDSVRHGLELIVELDPESLVLIHDGVRPLVSQEVLKKGIDLAKEHGAAACGVKPKDTVKEVGIDGLSAGTLDRAKLFLIHTPQIFQSAQILSAHRKILQEGVPVTDDTAVFERYFYPVRLFEDSYANIKITTVEDLVMAEALLKV